MVTVAGVSPAVCVIVPTVVCHQGGIRATRKRCLVYRRARFSVVGTSTTTSELPMLIDRTAVSASPSVSVGGERIRHTTRSIRITRIGVRTVRIQRQDAVLAFNIEVLDPVVSGVPVTAVTSAASHLQHRSQEPHCH